jgi:hypothetical protein
MDFQTFLNESSGGLSPNHNQTLIQPGPRVSGNHNQTVIRIPLGEQLQHNQTLVRPAR